MTRIVFCNCYMGCQLLRMCNPLRKDNLCSQFIRLLPNGITIAESFQMDPMNNPRNWVWYRIETKHYSCFRSVTEALCPVLDIDCDINFVKSQAALFSLQNLGWKLFKVYSRR